MDVLFWRPPSDIPLLLTSFDEATSSTLSGLVVTMTTSLCHCCSLTCSCWLLDFLASPLECKVIFREEGTIFVFVFSPLDPQHPSQWVAYDV